MKYVVIEVDVMENDPIQAIGPFSSEQAANNFIESIEEGCFCIVPLITKEDYEKDVDDIDVPVPYEPM